MYYNPYNFKFKRRLLLLLNNNYNNHINNNISRRWNYWAHSLLLIINQVLSSTNHYRI